MKNKVSTRLAEGAAWGVLFAVQFLKVNRLLPLEVVLTPFPLVEGRYGQAFQSAVRVMSPDRAALAVKALVFCSLLAGPFLAWTGLRLLKVPKAPALLALSLLVAGFSFFDPLGPYLLHGGHVRFLLSSYLGFVSAGLARRFGDKGRSIDLALYAVVYGLQAGIHPLPALLWLVGSCVEIKKKRRAGGVAIVGIVLGLVGIFIGTASSFPFSGGAAIKNFFFPAVRVGVGFDTSFLRGLIAVAGVGGILHLSQTGEKHRSRLWSVMAGVAFVVTAAGGAVPGLKGFCPALSVVIGMMVLSCGAAELAVDALLKKERDWPFWVTLWALWFLLIAPLGPVRWVRPLETGPSSNFSVVQ